MSSTLDVIDSYLSLNATQYAQAPIGATRIATFGDGTDVYGTIPTWTATNWEIEFDVVFPTSLDSTTRYILDSPDANNRGNFYVGNSNTLGCSLGGVNGYLDGVAINFGATAPPVDGAVHHVKLTRNGTVTTVRNILQSYLSGGRSTSALFNLRLTDLYNSANSRFYPMDETIATSTFLDTSANAQHGTWTGRVSGDVKTVYPDAIKPGEYFYAAIKYRITSNGPNVNPRLFTIGSSSGNEMWIEHGANHHAKGMCKSGGLSDSWYVYDRYTENYGADGLDHTLVLKSSATELRIYVDDIAYTRADTTVTRPLVQALNSIMLNNGYESTHKSNLRIYWFYLYPTLSPADIAALMQGEHPASVGNVRQGYNLLGDGSEINGGPALTLYGDPDFYVPRRNGLTFPLTSSLVSSLTSPLVSR